MTPCRPALNRLTLRLALAAVVAAASLATHTAHAAIITVDFSGNALSTVPFNLNGVYLNVVTGAATTNNVTGYDINPYFAGSTGATPSFSLFLPSTGGVIGTGTGGATRLSPGATVSVASTFITGVAAATFATSGTGYFGFRFLNESTGLTNYGYLTVSQTLPIAAGSVRVLGYAYENTGAAITVTAVPEPATYAMLALGLVGIGAAARRRAASAASAASAA